MALTKFPGTDISPRMGRPPLNVMETTVRLSGEHRQRIEALVGPNHMSAFIHEAVENELNRREKDSEGGQRDAGDPLKP